MSPYFLLSPWRYTRDGHEVRVGYSTRVARTIVLGAALADRLQTGHLDNVAPELMSRLCDDEVLTTSGPEREQRAAAETLRDGALDARRRVVTLMPTSYCNMECSYCGQEHVKGSIRQQRADQTIARVIDHIRQPATEALHIKWFGGEPMLGLRAIREMSAVFIAEAEAADVTYSAAMATNGSLLNRRTLQVLSVARVTSIDVTIDGPEEVHNARRLKRNRRGSYASTLDAIADSVSNDYAENIMFRIRVNVDNTNTEHIPALLEDLNRRGLANPRVFIEFHPVHSWGNDVSAVEVKLKEYAEAEIEWLELAWKLGINSALMPHRPKPNTCIATSRNQELIDTDGNLYACSEHPLVPVARDTGRLGSIADITGDQRPSGQFDDWPHRILSRSQACAGCPMLPVCGGSCPKLWSEGHLPCPSYKFNWAERLDLTMLQRGYTRVQA